MRDIFETIGAYTLAIVLFLFAFAVCMAGVHGIGLLHNHLSHFVQEQWIEDKEGGCK